MDGHYDAIVVGLGGMGSSALMHLATRGRRVLGLEQFHPAHALGSSHGGSRIIRKAYYEDPAYVPLIMRAYELWEELERRSGASLLLRTGGLMAGYEGSETVEGSALSARVHGLAHEALAAAEIRRRFPALRPSPAEVGIYEPDAGVLFPEQCVLAHLEMAIRAGAEARFGARVRSWQAVDDGVRLDTDTGELRAERLILCAGPWLAQIARDIALPLQVERNVMHWFDPRGTAAELQPGAVPVYILQRRGAAPLYGVPLLPGQGLKVAFHYSGQFTTPEQIDRNVSAAEAEGVRKALGEWIPGAAGTWRGSSVCMYTNTPDKHFVIGLHPRYPAVVIAGGFSGHGFKFCPVAGEILADLVLDGRTSHPIELFSPTRFAPSGPSRSV